MNELKKDLNLLQGIGLLSTSLLGSGVFAIPAIIALSTGKDSLWAWPLLLLGIFPIAICFAQLGKYYPNAGGVAYFISKAFNPKLGKITGWTFLSVIPFGPAAVLYIACSFWSSLFSLPLEIEYILQIATLLLILGLGFLGAGASGWVQSIIAILVVIIILVIGFSSSPTVLFIQWPSISSINLQKIFSAFGIMFWCFVGLEAFIHLSSEFKKPERDFPRALIIGLLIAGFIYWATTAAVLYFATTDSTATSALPQIMTTLFGKNGLLITCIIGYLACFASLNIYLQSFARLIWVQFQKDHPQSKLARLSNRQTPIYALSLVVGICLISISLMHITHINLDYLFELSNGVFVLIYLLGMIAAVKLLAGKFKIIAAISSIICLGLLIMIGYKSFYALGIFGLLWLFIKIKK